MEECPICQENVTLQNLSCSHDICRSCLSEWVRCGGSSCPICRANIDSNILTNNFALSDLVNSEVHHLNISISSPKGTSIPVTNEEFSTITELFGNASQINHINLSIGNKIMFQMYKSNCWFFGIISNVEGTSIDIKNCIFLQRYNGSIYNTTPSRRNIQYENRDSIYLISR